MQKSTPIFIAGTGRCGTTILQKILSRHRKIFVTQYEGRFIALPGGLITILSKNNDQETLPVFREKILGEWYEKYNSGERPRSTGADSIRI